MKAQQLLLRLIDWFHPLFKKVMPLKTYRYAVCGGSNLLLDILLYFIVYHFVLVKEDLDLGFIVLSPHIAALFIVFPITLLTGFLLNKFIAFSESTLQSKTQLRRYIMVTAGAIVLNYLLMKLFVDVMDFYPTPAKVLTTGLSVIYSYNLQSRYSFK